jgi:hypothetical protein
MFERIMLSMIGSVSTWSSSPKAARRLRTSDIALENGLAPKNETTG